MNTSGLQTMPHSSKHDQKHMIVFSEAERRETIRHNEHVRLKTQLMNMSIPASHARSFRLISARHGREAFQRGDWVTAGTKGRMYVCADTDGKLEWKNDPDGF